MFGTSQKHPGHPQQRAHVADDQIILCQRLSQITNNMLGSQGPSGGCAHSLSYAVCTSRRLSRPREIDETRCSPI
jgi:hypothetical protein